MIYPISTLKLANWAHFMSSTAENGEDGKALKQKRPTFPSLNAINSKNPQKFNMDSFTGKIVWYDLRFGL